MVDKEEIWVVDDDRSIRWVLEKSLQQADLTVRSFETGDAALASLQRRQPAVLITDIRMPGIDGLELLHQIHERWPDLPVIVITAHSDLDAAVSAYQGGAFEYLPKPFDVDDAVGLVRRALETRNWKSGDGVEADEDVPEIIGEAPAMQEVFRAIGRLSSSNINVLINGESGTGKELVARALHRHSPRRDKPFIALNMAAIPRDLMESELFGHEKGAFTGAQQSRQGRFEQAHGGTLFLDEIGDMPPELQTRLLRVLSDGQFYRVGGHTGVTVDVRIIAATHQDLERRVNDGHFREDLFHRLNVIRIHLPALRERREDIPKLARYFLAQAAEELGAEQKQLRDEVGHYLMGLTWQGNVRQLENTCRWLTVMANGKEIHMNDLPSELRQEGRTEHSGEDWEGALAVWAERALARGEQSLLERALPGFERIMIRVAIRATGGRRQDAARLLGWGRNTLTRKIKELDLDC